MGQEDGDSEKGPVLLLWLIFSQSAHPCRVFLLGGSSAVRPQLPLQVSPWSRARAGHRDTAETHVKHVKTCRLEASSPGVQSRPLVTTQPFRRLCHLEFS